MLTGVQVEIHGSPGDDGARAERGGDAVSAGEGVEPHDDEARQLLDDRAWEAAEWESCSYGAHALLGGADCTFDETHMGRVAARVYAHSWDLVSEAFESPVGKDCSYAETVINIDFNYLLQCIEQAWLLAVRHRLYGVEADSVAPRQEKWYLVYVEDVRREDYHPVAFS